MTLSEFEQNAFAQILCQDPHCYAQSTGGVSNPPQTKGIQYDVRVPDFIMTESECQINSVAVATTWIRFDNNDWIEMGVTAGAFGDLDDNGVGDTCIDDYEIAYWGYSVPTDSLIEEFEIGTVPVNSLQHFEISNLDGGIKWQLYWQKDRILADELIFLNPVSDTTDVGIEGSIPESSFVSIPTTHFANIESYESSWADFHFAATQTPPTVSSGYDTLTCGSEHHLHFGIGPLSCAGVCESLQPADSQVQYVPKFDGFEEFGSRIPLIVKDDAQIIEITAKKLLDKIPRYSITVENLD